MVDIERLKILFSQNKVELTRHFLNRSILRGIKISDVRNAIYTGIIIERYEDDFPFPSVLVLGKTSRNVPLHIVIGAANDAAWLITVYYPDADAWNNDFTIRKAVK